MKHNSVLMGKAIGALCNALFLILNKNGAISFQILSKETCDTGREAYQKNLGIREDSNTWELLIKTYG